MRLRIFDLNTPWFWLTLFYQKSYGEPWISLLVWEPNSWKAFWVNFWLWEKIPEQIGMQVKEQL